MKKLVLAFLFFTCISSASFAQASSNNKPVVTKAARGQVLTPEQNATNMALAIQKVVGFADNQFQAVYNVELEYYKLSAPGSGYRNPGALPTQRDEKLKGILTTEQYIKYSRSSNTLNQNNQ